MNIDNRTLVWRVLLFICLFTYLIFLYYAPSFGAVTFFWSALGVFTSLITFQEYILRKDICLGMATFKAGNTIGRLFALFMFVSIFIASITILYEI
jgi:hypothetical protein